MHLPLCLATSMNHNNMRVATSASAQQVATSASTQSFGRMAAWLRSKGFIEQGYSQQLPAQHIGMAIHWHGIVCNVMYGQLITLAQLESQAPCPDLAESAGQRPPHLASGQRLGRSMSRAGTASSSRPEKGSTAVKPLLQDSLLDLRLC